MTLLLIEDDEMTREMLAMLLVADGWSVRAVESGEDALRVDAEVDVVLSDLNLEGIGGEALALELRKRFAKARLLAMTATKGRDTIAGFESVLLKPVDAAAVRAAVHAVVRAGVHAGVDDRHVDGMKEDAATDDLSEVIYDKLMGQMPAARVMAFYEFALGDAETRVAKLRGLVEEGDNTAFKAEAHALKGGCAMVGAVRLSQLAGVMELEGIKGDTGRQLEVFMDGIERVRRILAEREKQ